MPLALCAFFFILSNYSYVLESVVCHDMVSSWNISLKCTFFCLFQDLICAPLGELARVISVWQCTIPVPGASKRCGTHSLYSLLTSDPVNFETQYSKPYSMCSVYIGSYLALLNKGNKGIVSLIKTLSPPLSLCVK